MKIAITKQPRPVQVQLPPEQQIDISPNIWNLFIDGSSAVSGSGVGIVFRTPEGAVIRQAVWLESKASNSEPEYKAVIVGMQKVGVQDLVVIYDSQAANQLTSEYASKNERMRAYMIMA